MADNNEEKEEQVTFIDDDKDETIVDLSPSKKEPAQDDRLAAAERELAELRSQISSTRNQTYGTPPAQPQSSDDNSSDNELDELERALGIRWEADKAAGRLRDPKLVEYYDKEARKIADKRAYSNTQKALRNLMPQIAEMNQAQYFRQQYSDVYNDSRAISYAKGAYQMLLAQGEPDTPQLVDKAMNQARIHFKLAGARHMKPTDRDRDQLSGVGGGGSGRPSADNAVRMGKAEKAMAMAMYGEKFNGDEKKVYQTWAQKIGVRAKKAASKAGAR